MSSNQDQTALTSLDEMSGEQLRLLIAAEMDTEQVNVELIRQATAILASRGEEEEHEIGTCAADFLQRAKADSPALFPEVAKEIEQTISKPQTGHAFRHTRLFKVVLVAAVIVVLLVGSAVAAGAAGLDLWGVVAKWSADTFRYSKERSSFQGGHFGRTGDYYPLQIVLSGYTDDPTITPHYMPEGYKLVDVGAEESFEGVFVYGTLSNGENEIMLRYLLSNAEQPNHFYAIDATPVETYTLNHIDHYIMTNEHEYVVNWMTGNTLCDISGIPTHEDAIKLIDSLYEGGA